MTGTVKWWNNERGWGLAYGEDGHDYFLGRRALIDVDDLESGDKIEFEPTSNNRGRVAEVIRLTQKTNKDYDGYWSPRDSFESAKLTTGEFNEP